MQLCATLSMEAALSSILCPARVILRCACGHSGCYTIVSRGNAFADTCVNADSCADPAWWEGGGGERTITQKLLEHYFVRWRTQLHGSSPALKFGCIYTNATRVDGRAELRTLGYKMVLNRSTHTHAIKINPLPLSFSTTLRSRKPLPTIAPLVGTKSEAGGEIVLGTADAFDSASYEDVLKGAKAVVIAVGAPPLPDFMYEGGKQASIKANGMSNLAMIDAAKKAGVPKVVVVGATMPVTQQQQPRPYTSRIVLPR